MKPYCARYLVSFIGVLLLCALDLPVTAKVTSDASVGGDLIFPLKEGVYANGNTGLKLKIIRRPNGYLFINGNSANDSFLTEEIQFKKGLTGVNDIPSGSTGAGVKSISAITLIREVHRNHVSILAPKSGKYILGHTIFFSKINPEKSAEIFVMYRHECSNSEKAAATLLAAGFLGRITRHRDGGIDECVVSNDGAGKALWLAGPDWWEREEGNKSWEHQSYMFERALP